MVCQHACASAGVPGPAFAKARDNCAQLRAKTVMRYLWMLLLGMVMALPARADALQDQFATVWESLWYQGGSPTRVVRWSGDIHVRIQGLNVSTHRKRILDALQAVSTEAGLRVVDVTDGGPSVPEPELEVALVHDLDLPDNLACYVRAKDVSNYQIRKSELKMRQGAVYYCALHEAMHVMGISGHPGGDTVLSYFHQRSDRLTELDRLMVRAWYSPRMRPGMTPLEAVVVLTNAVVDATGKPFDEQFRATQHAFLEQLMRQMEDFAGDKGEVPLILKRSGTASTEAIARGRTLMRFYLALAYRNGTIRWADPGKSTVWMERAARDGLAGAQWMMGDIAERGLGMAASNEDAYVWYALALAQEVKPAAQALERVQARMTPEQVEAARKRVAAFQ
jgi:hypothetical protein